MNTPEPASPALLDVELLRTFTAIVDRGSFNRAARVVHRTPSAVSMQVKRLEETLSRSLFERSGRNVTLTPDGEALLGYARRMLRLNEETLSHFKAPALEGVVRFGALDDFGTRFLPDMLLRFSRTHPKVHVEVRLATSKVLVEDLADAALDLALITTSDAVPARGEVVHREALLWAGLQGGCAHTRHPLPLALATQGCAWRRMALDSLDRAGIEHRICYTSEHSAGQQAALLSDLAVAPFPASLIALPLQVVPPEAGLPAVGHFQVELLRAPEICPAAQTLAGHVTASFAQFTG